VLLNKHRLAFEPFPHSRLHPRRTTSVSSLFRAVLLLGSDPYSKFAIGAISSILKKLRRSTFRMFFDLALLACWDLPTSRLLFGRIVGLLHDLAMSDPVQGDEK
jgi:hypothetical protein